MRSPSRLPLPFLGVCAERGIAVAVALGLALVFVFPGTVSAAESRGGAAPRVPEYALRALDGREFSHASLAGKVVVVNFWATWCPDCAAALPAYRALQARFADEPDFVFLAVSLDEESPAIVRRFVAKNELNYVVAIGNASVTEAFGGIGEIPTTFVLDRRGEIRHRKSGGSTLAELENVVRPLLAEMPAS